MLTPDEIELKTFPVTLRGFDQVEVTQFLETVAAELRVTLERAAALEAGAVLAAAKRDAAEVVAAARTEAEESARIRADALALSERELKQAAQECEEFRLKAVADIEAILERTDAEVAAMLQAVRANRDDLANIGQLHLGPRSRRKGSQRQLG
jgi:DivIVA domain-containing protein